MSEKKTAIERLEELLDKKANKIDELETKVADLESEAEASWIWTQHTCHDADPSPDLPVPRLEIRWIEERSDGYERRAEYSLVRKHFLKNFVFVPLGCTRQGGGNGSPRVDGKLDLPFRDGVHLRHDAKALNLPAFVVFGNEHDRIEV